jgi:outer membrane receptor protein involved in Fe transport
MDYGLENVVTRVRLPAHTRVDASATLPLLGRPAATGLAATLRIENLLGARYEEVRGFPARGRSILVGLRAEGGIP